MGCDIHMHVEFKRPHWEDHVGWRCGDHFSITDPIDAACKPEYVGLLEDRNYSLFAVLADVRNIYFVDPYPYISSPRGLPEDVTPYVMEEYESWGDDAHSCSYLAMREIFEFHEANKPKDYFGKYILEPLIDRLIQRADELHILYPFEVKNPTEEVRKRMEKIRIVFWFDN